MQEMIWGYNTQKLCQWFIKKKESDKNGSIVLHLLKVKRYTNTTKNMSFLFWKKGNLLEVGFKNIAACKLLWNGRRKVIQNAPRNCNRCGVCSS